MPIEERKEWLRINNNYRTMMRSVRSFLRLEVESKRERRLQEQTPADEEAEYQRVMAINDAWNLQIAQIRDARIAKVNAETREFIARRKEDKKIRDAEILERIEAKVRAEKEQSATFITRDNIDQAIEHALANPTDYNFSIDLQGNIYRGDERPGTKNVEKGEQLA